MLPIGTLSLHLCRSCSYITSNPYHNAIHGADVALSVHHMILRGLQLNLSPIGMSKIWPANVYAPHGSRTTFCAGIFASLFSALGHDVAHPGRNNSFLVKTKSALALRYNDVHVLENMHASTLFEILQVRTHPHAKSSLTVLTGLPIPILAIPPLATPKPL